MLFGTYSKERRLIRLAAVLCGISLVVFLFLLYQTNRQYNVQAVGVTYNVIDLHSVINRERIERGVSPLTINDDLMEAAQSKAADMNQNNYFSHISPVDGKSWSVFIKETGYTYKEAGENLANGYDTVEEMVDAWLNSPSHRENLLNENVSETGFGIVTGELNNHPTTYVVQVFGEQQVMLENSIEVR